MNPQIRAALPAHFQGYRGSGCPEISDPEASPALTFLSDLGNSSAPAARGVSLRFGFPVKTIEGKNPDQNNTSTDLTTKEHSRYRDGDPFR